MMWPFNRKPRYRKFGKWERIEELSSKTAYLRGIEEGKKAAVRRIISVLEAQKENQTFGENMTVEAFMAYLNLFV